MPQGHTCWSKAAMIRQRLGIIIAWTFEETHDIISELCNLWGCSNAEEFIKYANTLTDDQLRDAVLAAMKKLKKKKVPLSESKEASIYA